MTDLPAQRVAATVRAEMARRRVTQDQVAQRLGLSQSAVSRRLGGHLPFDVAELSAVAEILGVTPASLLDDVAVAS